jgi:hypothetical protein
MKCRGTPTGGCGRAGRIGGSAPGKFTKTPLKGFDGMGHSVVVHSLVSMPPDSLCTMAAWFVGEGPHLLRPQLIGLPLRNKGKEWGVVDGHGVAVCCAQMDGALRTCHDAVKHTIARSAQCRGCGLLSVCVCVCVWSVHSRSA